MKDWGGNEKKNRGIAIRVLRLSLVVWMAFCGALSALSPAWAVSDEHEPRAAQVLETLCQNADDPKTLRRALFSGSSSLARWSGDPVRRLLSLELIENLGLNGESLSLVDLPDLGILHVQNIRNIAALHAEDNPNLRQLSVFGSAFTELRLRRLPALTSLILDDTGISALDTTELPNLRELDAARNRLSTVDCRANPLLEEADLSHNELVSLTLRPENALRRLNLAGNKLRSAQFARGLCWFTILDVSGNNLPLSEIRILQQIAFRGTFGEQHDVLFAHLEMKAGEGLNLKGEILFSGLLTECVLLDEQGRERPECGSLDSVSGVFTISVPGVYRLRMRNNAVPAVHNILRERRLGKEPPPDAPDQLDWESFPERSGLAVAVTGRIDCRP